MVQLARGDITTEEVFEWKGIHLFHFTGSTCSKKIRILLDYKQVDWTSHPINLVKRENNSDWFMGINPRGLVPVLVHDGQVHIESNDILDYLESLFPDPALKPEGQEEALENLLALEDDLHLDLRNLTLRFTAPSKLMRRSKEELDHYEQAGTSTVGGERDAHKEAEIAYWREFSANGGVSESQAIASTLRFLRELESLKARFQNHSFLLGDAVSLADISWFVTINRIVLAGYPLKRLHPGWWDWRERLLQLPAFANEGSAPAMQLLAANVIWLRNKLAGKTLPALAGI